MKKKKKKKEKKKNEDKKYESSNFREVLTDKMGTFFKYNSNAPFHVQNLTEIEQMTHFIIYWESQCETYVK